MIYSIFPSKDATLYEKNASLNSGIDEILELTKIVSASNTPNIFNTRIAIDFDTTAVSASVASNEISASDGTPAKYYLKMFNIAQEQVPHNYTLEAAPISESWSMGLGRTTHIPATKAGVSWTYRHSYAVNDEWYTAGGTIYTPLEYKATQEFTNASGDINMDVTSIITGSWSGSDIDALSNGILIKRPEAQESNGTRYGSLKYFSKETHTIYSPRLEVMWDDSQFITGSLAALEADNISIRTTNLASEYKEQSKARIGILASELYPNRTYTTTSTTALPEYLPSTSYYAIIDA